MPDDLSILDQLEEWLEAQVPPDLHDLPFKMLETMERVTNEIFDSLNMHGPPSISIPFPPFSGKEIVPPPPPPPPLSLQVSLYNKADRFCRGHPYVTGALAVSLGLGLGTVVRSYRYKQGRMFLQRSIGTRGVVQDGMLKEAVVLLSPSPMPPLLWSLAVTLLKAGYIVIVAVPQIEDAEQLERRLTLDEKSALRVLIYDPEDSSTFPLFHRSLLATQRLRFPVPGNGSRSVGIADRVHAEYDNLPHIHAFISLYALNPSPPTQPGALPALPTLLAATGQTPPKLITLYPSGSMISTPDSFASQLLTSNHLLLQRNLVASTSGSFVSIFIGHLQLPPLAQSMSDFRTNGHAMRFRERVHQATRTGKLQVIRDYVVGGLGAAWTNISGFCGIGFAAQDYANFERTILRALRSRRRSVHATGQYSWLPLFIRNVHPHRLNRVLAMLPTMPGATGPLSAAVQGQPAPRKTLASVGSATSSTSSSDHEGGEDLVSSRHTVTSDEGVSVGSGNGMDASWVGVEAGN